MTMEHDDDKRVATSTPTAYYNNNSNNVDIVNGTIDKDVSSSLPNPEELRTSSTSRVNHNSTGCGSSSYRKITSLFVFFIFIVLVVIVPSIVVSKNKKTINIIPDVDDNEDETIINNERPQYDDIIQFIVSNQISSELDLKEYPTSPQSLAVDWLINVDPQNVPVPSKQDTILTYTGYMYMVRYIMALNYFALLQNSTISSTRNINFLSDHHVCDWNTIGTNYDEEDMGLFCVEFTEFFLEKAPYMLHIENQLSGSIPTENGLLSTLETLILSNNRQLSNTIPTELCNLQQLQSLQLHHNELSGTIPDCLYQLRLLEILDISNNLFVKTIPQTICRLQQLKELKLHENVLTGNIPTCFGEQPSLTQLVLSINQLDGIIPVELCYLSNLLYLDLHNNELNSTIPSCIGSMSVLQTLDVSMNELYGVLPNELMQLNNTLVNVIIHDNYLTGDPTRIFNEFRKLNALNMRDNKMSLTIDTMFLNSSKDTLQHLDISFNAEITGSFPNHMLLSFPKLKCLDVSYNKISGDLVDLDNNDVDNTVLKILALNNNNMTGSIANLVRYTGLVYLDVSNNDFTGAIESIMFDQLSQIRYLYLRNNPFQQGPIPDSLGLLQNIEVLSLRNTNRTGPLLDLSNYDNTSWTALTYIDFGSNNIEGTIPVSYRRLSELQYFIFYDNEFINGTIPDELNEIKELVGVLLDSTAIDPPSIYTNLCPSMKNDENRFTVAVMVINCMGECSDECSACQCCDIQNLNVGCTPNILGKYDDFEFELLYRRTTDYYTDAIAFIYDNIHS